MTAEDEAYPSADEARARLGEIRAQINALHDEATRLESFLAGPLVQTLAHYWRYHSEFSDEFDTVEDAVSFLSYSQDNGDSSPIGVSVNGEMVVQPKDIP